LKSDKSESAETDKTLTIFACSDPHLQHDRPNRRPDLPHRGSAAVGDDEAMKIWSVIENDAEADPLRLTLQSKTSNAKR
jgi:hypothetical protein